MNEYPIPQQPEDLNIAATNRLLALLSDEANSEMPSISDKIVFNEFGFAVNDGRFVSGLNEIRIPNNSGDPLKETTFQIGIHPDGYSQINMTECYKGACLGKLMLILRPGETTKANGYRPSNQGAYTEHVDNETVTAETLEWLEKALPVAFEANKERTARKRKQETIIGSLSLAFSDWRQARRKN
jgi:hypothetical protein